LPPVNVDELVQQACDETGHDDFGAPQWREGLEHLVAALDAEGGLNEIGQAVVPGDLTNYLKDRLDITAYRAEHPELADVDIVPPIVIVGQGRTGTTILYDLLSQDPASRVPRTWEVDRPVPPPERSTYETDPRIEEVDATLAMVDLVLPDFRAMHPMGARLAQECVRITGSDFRSMIFPTQYHVPSYGQWLIHRADMSSAYAWHRIFLQHLQARHPAQRWVLKSPGHIWCLQALLTEYPNALLVQTHRDPLRIIASLASLVARLRQLSTDESTIPMAAAEFAPYIVDGLDWSIDARDAGVVTPERVVDLQFAEFMVDPFGTIRTIYDRLGLELTADTERRMRDFLAANPQDAHGGHTYTWADTGLDEGEWRERAKRYQDHFDVPSEPLG
jgi:hypothetical protein